MYQYKELHLKVYTRKKLEVLGNRAKVLRKELIFDGMSQNYLFTILIMISIKKGGMEMRPLNPTGFLW
jgi:hypothetical protein